MIGEDGRMTDAAGERFAGMPVLEAREAVVAALREEGRLRAEEPYTHSVPFSHRSGERIEPLISLQWFCRMDELAKPAIEVVKDDEVRIVPEQWKRVYLDWMEEIRPWCVSRQLWWGHRLPVWYCDACEETYVAEGRRRGAERCDGELRQDEDVLDTWFSSALWPFATLGWPDDTPELRAFYPTDFLTTAREIIFLWVARMVMMGPRVPGEIPFHDVYIHSVIQAPDGRRMSKSLGTGIDPLDEIEGNGADAVRFGLLAMSSTQDVRYSEAKVQQGRDLANKMWNASRLVLLNVADVAPAPSSARAEDRWIVSRLERTVESVSGKIEEYDFAHAALELYDRSSGPSSATGTWRSSSHAYDAGSRTSRPTLLSCLERFLALAHPLLPFVTEAIWAELPGHEHSPPLVVSRYPTPDADRLDPEAEAELAAQIDLTRAIRRWRDLAGVAVGSLLAARVANGAAPHELVGRLARIEIGDAGGDALG